jgi:hypothetical protein
MAAKQKSSPKDSSAGLGYEADPGKEETPDPGTATKDGRRAPGVHGKSLSYFRPIGKDEPDFF